MRPRSKARLRRLRKNQEARRFEVLCLSTPYPASLNHVRYLADLYGDGETVQFLHNYLESTKHESEREECLKLIGALQSRLGRTPPASAFVNSKLWTG